MPKAAARTTNQPANLGKLPLAVLETINAPVQVVARDYRIVWSNTFTSDGRTLGPAELVDNICHEFYFGRATPCPDCPLDHAFATGQEAVKEKMFPLSDGSTAWREVRSYPIRGEDGRTAYVVKIGFDITAQKIEQRRTEKYLEYLENSLQKTAGESPSGQGTAGDAGARFGLTEREVEVLRLVAKGFTNSAIAKILGISPHTVKTHTVHIFDKLGVSDRARAAVWAARLNLV